MKLVNLFSFVLVTEHASDELPHLIKALLVAHVEPKLNVIFHHN
jgi:hypothetical protein